MAASKLGQLIERLKVRWASLGGLRWSTLPVLAYAILDGIGRIETLANLVSFGGQFPAVMHFFQSSFGAMAFGASFLWASYILFRKNRWQSAGVLLVLGTSFMTYGSFIFGQQVPPPNVQLKFFDPFPLDENNAPIVSVSDSLISMPLRTNGLLPYANAYNVAMMCRPNTPGIPPEYDINLQIGLFQPIKEKVTLEIVLGPGLKSRLCK